MSAPEHRRPPSVQVSPQETLEDGLLTITGTDWSGGAVTVTIAGRPVRLHDTLRGSPVGTSDVRSDAHGTFTVQVALTGVEPGTHDVVAYQDQCRVSAAAHIRVEARRRVRDDDRVDDAPYWRARDFFDRRFGALGFVPRAVRDVQIGAVRGLRAEKAGHGWPPPGGESKLRTLPVAGVCNWNPVGPNPVPHGQTAGTPTQAVSGRVLAIAIDPTSPTFNRTVLIGTAGGGVWKSTDSGTTWSPKTDHQISLAIGALAIDPTEHHRVLAGTGEYGLSSLTNYYGRGVLRSEDGGEIWTEQAGTTFDRAAISRIVFDPDDLTGQRVYLSASNGVFESKDNGKTWASLWAGSASDLVALVPAGPPGRLTLIAAGFGSGLFTSTRDVGGTWVSWTQVTDPDFPTSFGQVALGQCAGTPRTIYAVFAAPSSASPSVYVERVVRTTDGGASWSPVTVRLDKDLSGWTKVAGSDNHKHKIKVPAGDLTVAPAAHTYTTTGVDKGTPHTHSFDLTADAIEELARGAVIKVATNADLTGHQHQIEVCLTAQCSYNLHISVRPDNPDVIYLGEVQLWRNTAGGGVFEVITDGSGPMPLDTPYGIHVDQHTFAFDPADANVVWAGNDGGIYRSFDGGDTWQHRNRDLQILQHQSVATHPTREAVMIGGTQDNGTHRYAGHPAWAFVYSGDGGVTEIDPVVPTRMYHLRPNNVISRSDDAGASWSTKISGITGTSEFYAPFVLDPSDHNVCYYGGEQLWRSANNAEAWTAVTSSFASLITAVAVHPTDPTIVYVGTRKGRVHRVQRTGGTWTPAGVTTTDLTAAPLPSPVHISDLAVDTAGTVWVTISSVTTDASGQFTNHHVFRLDPVMGAWEIRVTGLAPANPVNTIVIDPASTERLFVGADLGVFRTDDGGMTWTVWDEGLPNVPVFDLRIGPLRLMRAATHGRGVWERPIDSLSCPPVDLYLRDNILDTGRVIPSYDGVPHPFDPTINVYHWQSPDIKVDALDPAFQTSTAISDYVVFEADLEHETARRGVANRLYAQVHNRGPMMATKLQVRAFFASAALGLPALPGDFWSSGKPFVGTPSGPNWMPVGPTIEIPKLEPAEPGVVCWEWTVPVAASKYSCLLVVATCAEDPIDGGGILDTDELVLTRKHVAVKSFNVEKAVPGKPMPPDQVFLTKVIDVTRQGVPYDLELHWGNLPQGSRVFVAFERPRRGGRVILAGDDELGRLDIRLAHAGHTLFLKRYQVGLRRRGWFGFPWPRRRATDERRHFDLARVYELPRPDRNLVIFPNIRVPRDASVAVAVNVALPAQATAAAQFDLIQRLGDRIVGGSTYLLHMSGHA